jgi:homocysteine S-methyltransferase
VSGRGHRLTADGSLYLTDGGFETVLVFQRGIDLPCFASFPLIDRPDGVAEIRSYVEPFVEIARRHGTGALLSVPTWRASSDWGARLGYDEAALDDAVRRLASLYESWRAEWSGSLEVAIEGQVGPRGDGYVVGERMSAGEAERYHRTQLETFADTGIDLASALTLTYVDEAVGIVRAAAAVDLPVSVGFTVERDGRLPSGQDLGSAVREVDEATAGAPLFYLVNCAHPTHVANALADGDWRGRIGGLRPNASRRSHAELDAAEELDDGDPADLGEEVTRLRPLLPGIRVLGGCCGTDERHVAAIADRWLAA